MAEVKVTKNPASTPENVIFDFEIPGGEKGDPGGFTSGTNLGNVSLDTLKAPGLYKQSGSSNVTLANGYPANLANASEKRCIIEVTQWGATEGYVNQIVYPINGNNAVGIKGGAFYKRSSRNGTDFTDWEAYSSTRADETAGRAIYQWDDKNNREQLIYGDTGWRDIRGLLTNGWTGIAQIRRVGSAVTLKIVQLSKTNTSSDDFMDVIDGFRGDQVWIAWPEEAVNVIFREQAGKWTATNRSSQRVNLFGLFTFTTTQAWPTTLPGTAVGNIPNL